MDEIKNRVTNYGRRGVYTGIIIGLVISIIQLWGAFHCGWARGYTEPGACTELIILYLPWFQKLNIMPWYYTWMIIPPLLLSLFLAVLGWGIGHFIERVKSKRT